MQTSCSLWPEDLLVLVLFAQPGPSSHDAALGSLFHTSCDHGSPTNLPPSLRRADSICLVAIVAL